MDITWAADLTPSSTLVTAIDANNNLIVNGQPIVMIGLNGSGYTSWEFGGYTETQADAMLTEAVAAGFNIGGSVSNMGTYCAPPYQNMENVLIQQAKFGIYAGYSSSLGMTPWTPTFPYPPLQPIETTNVNTYKTRSKMIAWGWVSEEVCTYYATLLPHLRLPKTLDPLHRVMTTEIIRDAGNHNYGHFYATGAIGDGGYWDEGVNDQGLNIPVVEFVQSPNVDKLWEYIFFMNRRVRGLSKAAPLGQLSAAGGGAGALTGTYRFVYTWSYGTGYRDPDAVESFAAPASVDLVVSNSQIVLAGFQDPGVGNTFNVYGFKVGASASDGMWSTSNYHMIVAGLSHTTTTYTVTTDYPWDTGQDQPAAPPPARTSLGWIPSISTTINPELFHYSSIRVPSTFDQTSRWYWLQVAMNCRAFEVLWANWERCPTGDNFPVVLALTQNTKIAFTSDTNNDNRTCSIEGILTDGVTIAREDNLTMIGVTNPTVQSANTYSLVKWVAVQSSHATATITVTQVTGGNNILGTHPYFGGNPPFVMAAGSDSAYFKAGNDGLPNGYLQAWHDTWTVLGRITGLASMVTAPAQWARIGSVIPAFVVFDDSVSGVNFKGVYAAKKTVGSTLYVIAINIQQSDPLGTEQSLTGATMDVGQTINTCVRIAGESGSPSFTGSVITDNFTPSQVHVYQIT